MKLYDFGPAANAKRVRIFLAEKQLEVPIVELNVRDDKQFQEPFTSMNPFHCVPFLELDDGTGLELIHTPGTQQRGSQHDQRTQRPAGERDENGAQ